MRTSLLCFPLLFAAIGAGQTAGTFAPYSGDELAVRTQTLPDGTQVTQKTVSGRLYRDSQGRTRAERSLAPDTPDVTLTVEVIDPVAGVRYSLDTRNKVAHRSPLTPVGSRRPTRVTVSDEVTPPGPTQQASVEALGQRMMGGVLTEGRRILTTILPAADSNDHMNVLTTEMWFSDQLGLTLASKVSDPNAGDYTYSIRNVTLQEPNATLFQVPADYTIVDAPTTSSTSN